MPLNNQTEHRMDQRKLSIIVFNRLRTKSEFVT